MTTDRHAMLRQHLESTMSNLATAERRIIEDRELRDELVRQALKRGMTYAELAGITGLSRAMLDVIRRAPDKRVGP